MGVELVQRVRVLLLDILVFIQDEVVVLISGNSLFSSVYVFLLFFIVDIFSLLGCLTNNLVLLLLTLLILLLLGAVAVLLSAAEDPTIVIVFTAIVIIVIIFRIETFDGLHIVRLAKLVILAINCVALLLVCLGLVLPVAANPELLLVVIFTARAIVRLVLLFLSKLDLFVRLKHR